MYNYIIVKSLVLYFLVNIFKCDVSDKSHKQLKYDACYKLVQTKAGQEQSYFKELSQDFTSEEINNILQYTLFECYQNINYFDAEDIDSKNPKDIDVYQENYMELINFEKWEELLRKKDENNLQYALMDLQQAYRDIQSGEIKINRYQKKQNQKPKKSNMEDSYYQRDNDNEQFNFPTDMEGDFRLFGFNFSSLPNKLKNIIGFSLIIFIFMCIIFGLKWIQNIRGSNDNKKKKNKKDKKDKKKLK